MVSKGEDVPGLANRVLMGLEAACLPATLSGNCHSVGYRYRQVGLHQCDHMSGLR